VLDVNGITVAQVAATFGTNGVPAPAGKDWAVTVFDPSRPDVSGILADAARARRDGADVVVASVHCCVEYVHDETPAQRAIARALLASPDVDLVLGHHAHVVQPFERIDGEWAAYGLGNLIVGYNTSPGNPQTGSHNLVVGDYHSYTSFGGAVMGEGNAITGPASTVTGGSDNQAAGEETSISGGTGNLTTNEYSWIGGGFGNQSAGYASSVSGGGGGRASGYYASVFGGNGVVASGTATTAGGGSSNRAEGGYDTVIGGSGNVAAGGFSVVSGGSNNRTNGFKSVVGGGLGHVAPGIDDWVAGGLFQDN